TDIEEVRIRVPSESLPISRTANVDEAAGIRDAARGLEEHRARDREDRRVRADADGERGCRCQGKDGIAAERPNRIADILEPAVKHERPPDPLDLLDP